MKTVLALSHSGVVSANRAIYRFLAEAADAKITLVVPTRWKGDLIEDLNYLEESQSENFVVRSVPVRVSGNGSLFTYSKLLKNLQQELKPDILIVDEEPWSLAALQAYFLFSKVPIKCFFSKQNIKKQYPPPFSFIEKWIYRESSFVFAISREVQHVLESKGLSKPTHLLPHSVDPEIFTPLLPNEKATKRKELGIPENAIVVAYAGRLTEEKGVKDLMGSMKAILNKPELNSLFFLWIGNGPLSPELQEWMAQAPSHRARMMGATPHDQIGSYLALCDILVLPSRTYPHWKEQFGRILIEAMACKVAVIGSDSGEIPKLIEETQGGLIFQEGNEKELQKRIEFLCLHPHELAAYKTRGFDSILREYTHQAVARKWAINLGLNLRHPGL